MVASWRAISNDFQIQLEYVWYEFHTVPMYELNELQVCSSIGCAADVAGGHYEGTVTDDGPGTAFGDDVYQLYTKRH